MRVEDLKPYLDAITQEARRMQAESMALRQQANRLENLTRQIVAALQGPVTKQQEVSNRMEESLSALAKELGMDKPNPKPKTFTPYTNGQL